MLAILWLLMLVGCLDDSSFKKEDLVLPKDFAEIYYDLDRNPLTTIGVQLGKRLFFDPILSRDGSISCNSCHKQQRAFADAPHHRVSIGVNDLLGKRNAPTLQNLAYIPEFSWDGGVTHLDFTSSNAITTFFEMDTDLKTVVKRLNEDLSYREQFKKAFDDSISGAYVQLALSQFLISLISNNSRYDQFLKNSIELDTLELAGLNLFKKKCASCHKGVLFSDFNYHNNGFDSVFADSGRGRITNDPQDIGKFRTPTLRNIEVSSPYMHDGRFNSLEEVLDHYSNLNDSKNIDSLLKPNNNNRPALLSEDKRAIVAFLKTLTDREFLNNEKHFKGN